MIGMNCGEYFKKSMQNNDRVRENTAPAINEKIDDSIHKELNHYYNDPFAIEQRLKQLEKEWDIERMIELNAAAIGLTGVLLSLAGNRKWLLLPLAVTGFLAQHAVQGWCPPVTLFRRLGIRTRKEIDKEKYALKALRGDFKYLIDVPNVAWNAVNK